MVSDHCCFWRMDYARRSISIDSLRANFWKRDSPCNRISGDDFHGRHLYSKLRPPRPSRSSRITLELLLVKTDSKVARYDFQYVLVWHAAVVGSCCIHISVKQRRPAAGVLVRRGFCIFNAVSHHGIDSETVLAVILFHTSFVMHWSLVVQSCIAFPYAVHLH